MNPALYAPLVAGCLLVGTFVFLEIGRRIGLQKASQFGEKARTGLGAVEGAIFGVLGLLIAFSFSGAMQRFDERRHLIVDQANAIGTAWLRLDLLPSSAQPELRALFRRYVDSNLAIYQKLPDIPAARAEREECIRLENEIWKRAVDASVLSDRPQASMLAVSSLNTMIDLANSETMATRIHPPWIIFVMLAFLVLIGSFLAGFAMAWSKGHHWFHILSFALVVAVTVYIILDIEYPLVGLIRINMVDQALLDLRHSMSAP